MCQFVEGRREGRVAFATWQCGLGKPLDFPELQRFPQNIEILLQTFKIFSLGTSLVAQWLRIHLPGFPGGTVVENLPANAGDTGSSPGLGRSHMPRSN